MEAFGQLAGGIAHDFNNLLTVIQGNAQFLLDELEEADPHRQEAGDILRTSHRAAALTHQLLAFSRKQVLTTRVLRLGDIVNGLMPLFRRLIGHNIDLQAVCSRGYGQGGRYADGAGAHQPRRQRATPSPA